MSTIISVRGWLECDDTQLENVKKIIALHPEERYKNAWAIPKKTGSWINYVFFGGDLDPQKLEWLDDQLQKIATLEPPSKDEYIKGVFFVHSETEGRSEWLVKDGKLAKTEASDKYLYLDQ